MEVNEFDKEILELAAKYNLTQNQIIRMYKFQWKMVRMKMKYDFKTQPLLQRSSIKLKGFGTFHFLPYIANLITERRIAKYERLVREEEELIRKKYEEQVLPKETSSDGDRSETSGSLQSNITSTITNNST